MPADYVMYYPDIFVSPEVELAFIVGVGVGLLFVFCGLLFASIFDIITKLIDRKRNSPPSGEDKNSN